MGKNADVIKEALDSIVEKVNGVSGQPPDITEEVAAIKDAAGVKDEED